MDEFGQETSELFSVVCKVLMDKNNECPEFSYWLDEGQNSWRTIDKQYIKTLKFSSVEDFVNEDKIKDKLNNLWE